MECGNAQLFTLRGDQHPLDFRWQLNKNEVAGVIYIILPAFINDADQVILLGLRVGDDLIHLPCDQGRFVVGIVNAKNEMLLGFHRLSLNVANDFKFHSLSLAFSKRYDKETNIQVQEFHPSRILLYVSSIVSGRTRVSPRVDMKFESPVQRGTMCRWTWSGTPAPAALPMFAPMLKACGW
jgi:hypothetical protein